jgi:hypothetical protein
MFRGILWVRQDIVRTGACGSGHGRGDWEIDAFNWIVVGTAESGTLMVWIETSDMSLWLAQ